MTPITVLLADDHTIVREGFRALLELEADIRVVGEARDGREAVALAAKCRPDVVVMDIAMPVLNGFGATRQIVKQTPGTKVLILSAHSDDPYIRQVLAMGAAGFLIKQTSAQSLSKAIRELRKGNTFFSPSIATYIRDRGRDAGRKKLLAKSAAVKALTGREMEVLQAIAEGDANKQIATALGVSIKTVEKHRQHLMEKLGIHDIAGLTRYAIANGIIESSVQTTIIRDRRTA